jgi:integrase
MSTERGRHRPKPQANHHLFLRGGVWWTRFEPQGRKPEVRSTGCPKSEVARARDIRDERQARLAQGREGIEIPCAPLTLGDLIAKYLEAESQPYDRTRGGEQPGTKRSPDSDRSAAKAILRHVSPDLSAACVKRERLLDLADRREREKPTPAPLSRRNTLAFLRRVFAWAARKPSRTGIIQSPFEKLTREDRKRLFPRGRKRAYIYSPGQLRTIYDRLPPHALPFVRFAAHTGMRLREIATLTWGNVHPDERRVYVESRFGKGPNGGKARDVALGAIPCAILEALRPLEPDPGAEVFRGARGGPIDERNIQEAFDRALLGTSSRAKKRKHEPVWKPANADEKKPRFHDLRKTAATRIEAVSSHAVANVSRTR